MAQPALPDGPAETARQIADDLARSWARIMEEQARLLEQWPGQAKPVRLERLRAMEVHVTDLMAAAQQTLDSKVPGMLAEAYEVGAWGAALQTGAAAAFSAIDLDAITVLARDTMDDLLAGTRGVTASTRSLVQTMSRDRILNATYAGMTAEQAGVRLAADLQGEGIYSILYNGTPPRRVALPTYTDMVVRTKTAVAYQEGGFQQGKQLGIEWWEIMDGPDCGLSFHDDPTLADGMIVRTADAEKFPISHPNCVRVTSPRPDIEDARQAAAAKPTPTEKQREDQAAASRAREAAYARNPRRNSLTRQVDREMGLRSQFDSTSYGAMSPAEARAAARVSAADAKGAAQVPPRAAAADTRAAAAAPAGPADMSYAEMQAYRASLSEAQWQEKASAMDDWFSRRFATEEAFDSYRGNIGLSDLNAKARDAYVVDDDATLAMLRSMRDGRALSAKAKKIEAMIADSTVKEPVSTWRGAILDDDVVARLTPGARWSDKAFQSTDLDPAQALWYAGERAADGAVGRTVRFRYDLATGTQARYVGYGEVVVQRNVQFVISEVVEVDDVLEVVLKEAVE